MTPPGFTRMKFPPSPYMESSGPFYGRWDAEQFVLALVVEEKHCNAQGVCHGGMISTFCDVVLTVGSNIQSGQSRFLPTISMTCDFLGPAPKGSVIEARPQVHRVTRNLLFASALLEIAGEPVARTSGVVKIGGDPDPRFHPDRYFD